MIPQISRGKDPQGLMDYLLIHPGKTNEHTAQRVVTSSIGTPEGQLLTRDEAMQVAADLQAPQEAWDVDVSEGHIWQCSLSIKAAEGQLQDQKWRDISKDFMQEMGMPDDLRWVSVRHGLSANGNDHVHIAANVVRENGALADTWNDFYRSQEACSVLETRHGLEQLQRKGARALSRSELKHHGEPERYQLERQIRATASVVTTDSEFFHELDLRGIKVRPYIQEGRVTGYSVALPGKNARKFAGGKLARDLSLPRLQMVWKSNASTKPTHIRAVQELQDLQRKLPTADALALEDASHQLAGALAAASLATEDPPGDLANASRQAGSYAQTVRAHTRPKPPALSAGALFLFAADPTGPVGKSVMIMQLLAAFRALMDAQFARRGLVTTRERIPSMAGQAGPEEEMLELGVTTGLTTGALLLEHHARAKEAAAQKTANDPKKDLWDAKKIRQMRKEQEAAERAKTTALRPPPGTERISPEQLAKAESLATELDMPSVRTLAEDLTAREAELYLAEVESKVVRPVAPRIPEPAIYTLDDAHAFEDGLIAKHGDKVPSVHTQQPNGHPYGKPGDVPATDLQVLWLTRTGGLSEDEARKMTKSGADSYRNSVEKTQGLTPKPKVQKPPPGRGPGLGK